MNPFGKFKLLSSVKTPTSSQPSIATPPTTTSGSNAPSTTVAPPTTTPVPHVSKMHVAGKTGYLTCRPGLARNLWAAHPNRTTRKLRKLLVSWEELGFFFSFSGAPLQMSPAAENSFLKVKVSVARSVSFLKSIRGVGDISRETSAKERNFIEILERFPSLYAVSSVGDEDKKELFYAWHSLYLFLHKVLGADPYEASDDSVPFPIGYHGEAEGARTNVRPFRAGKTA